MMLGGPGLPAILKDVFTYENLVHAVSGSLGSGVALTVFFPLDTVRTRLQIEDHAHDKYTLESLLAIFQQEGVIGLYRGWYPVVTSLCCSNFVYFYVFHGLKALNVKSGQKPEVSTDLVLAFIAGVVNVLTTTPLWVVNTRLKLQGAQLKSDHYKSLRHPRYSGILDALWKITKLEGLHGLWSGTVPSLFLVCNPTIQFMMYEALKRHFQRTLKTENLSGILYFLIGAIAKMVATFVTYPMQVVQSRLRAGMGRTDEKSKKSSILGCFAELIRIHGVFGLYRGLEAKLIQTVLTAALMFLTYEKIAAFVFHMMGLKAPLSKRF